MQIAFNAGRLDGKELSIVFVLPTIVITMMHDEGHILIEATLHVLSLYISIHFLIKP